MLTARQHSKKTGVASGPAGRLLGTGSLAIDWRLLVVIGEQLGMACRAPIVMIVVRLVVRAVADCAYSALLVVAVRGSGMRSNCGAYGERVVAATRDADIRG